MDKIPNIQGISHVLLLIKKKEIDKQITRQKNKKENKDKNETEKKRRRKRKRKTKKGGKKQGKGKKGKKEKKSNLFREEFPIYSPNEEKFSTQIKGPLDIGPRTHTEEWKCNHKLQ